MIIEGMEGVASLPSIYKSLNQEYFGNVLPSIPVKWSGKLKTSIGIAVVKYMGSKKWNGFGQYMSEIPVADVSIVQSSMAIKLSKTFDLELPDIKAVMLHEMVHILLYTKKKLGMHHGTPEFDGWIKKLRKQSGYNVPFLESDYRKSPKLKAKEGMVMLIFLMAADSNPGICVYSKNFFLKQWEDFMERMALQVSRSAKVNSLEIYKISHPIVSAMGARRTGKGLKWQDTDDTTVKEIQRGKQFMYVDKSGGEITPSVIGITNIDLDIDRTLKLTGMVVK